MKSNTRDINIDVLRVIMMFFILIEHMLVFSVFHDSYTSSQVRAVSSSFDLINFLGFEFVETICSIAVNCFIFITGFFYISNHNPKGYKIMYTWIHVFFYSFGISLFCYFIGLICDMTILSFKDLVKSMFVIRSPYYWFVPQYLGLLLVSPYLARVVDNFTKKQYFILLLCLGCLSVSFWGVPFGNIFGAQEGAGFIWFVFLFYTAGYIRLYVKKISNAKVLVALIVLLLVEFLNLSLPGICGFLFKQKLVYNFYSITTGTNGIVYLLSVAFFLLVLNLKLNSRFWHYLAKCSPYVFAAYLITSHKGIKFFLYEKLNLLEPFFCSIYFFPLLLFFSTLIFACCILIDKVREELFKKIKIEEVLRNVL